MEELIMSHTLELPDELYAALLEAADASGLTPIDWIAVHLVEARGKKEIEGEQTSHARTLADLFVGRVGRIRSGGTDRPGRFIPYALCRGAEHASGRAALDYLAVPGGSDVPVVAGGRFSGSGRVVGAIWRMSWSCCIRRKPESGNACGYSCGSTTMHQWTWLMPRWWLRLSG